MGARGAVEILHRRADADERAQRELDYEERYLNPYVAAERGLVDAVIDPAETRLQLASALVTLSNKREHLGPRAHDNTPL
jgi:acetyl-CoA carboxylase carboxyltransferase component